MDLVNEKCAADVRQACFFFGERIKGLRRKGVEVDLIPDDSWCDFFELINEQKVLMQAWRPLVERMAQQPERSPREIVEESGLGTPPNVWSKTVRETAKTMRPDHPDGSVDQKLRFLMGRVMESLRGRVPAIEVELALREAVKDKV